MNIRIVTVEEMRAIEAAADLAGTSYGQMMETAGRAVAERARIHLRGIDTPRVLVLVGTGNNGGDGLVAARLLAADYGERVAVVLARPRDDENARLAREAGCAFIDGANAEALRALAAGADLIVDALLGTGAKPPVRGETQTLLRHILATLETRPQAIAAPPVRIVIPARPATAEAEDRPFVLAVDLPSGLDADTGALDESTLHADETITFEAAKWGHFAFPGAESVGQLVIASLNLPSGLPERDAVRTALVDAPTVRAWLPARPASANKGTFGRALIVGGSENYVGAPGLAALGAYRAGAGLVTVAAPARVVASLAPHLLEATWVPLPDSDAEKSVSDAGASLAYTQLPDYDALLIGPGIGRTFNAYGLIETLFKHAGDNMPPLVIDADGLNMLATVDAWWDHLPARTVLTPHPGEMARLAKIRPEGERTSAGMVQERRLALAREKAAEWNCVVVLKGAYTIVADPDGQTALIPFADAALARAGTGDVLAGIIVGLLAQRVDPFRAAAAGAYVHGYAGLLAADSLGTRASVLAGDVSALIPAALQAIEAAG